MLEAIRDAAEIDDADSAPQNLHKLAALLEDEDEPDVVAQRLGEIIGLSDHVSSPDETFRAVRTFLEALARARPVVVVFDDIHWGEATFLDLVDRVAERIRDAPVLLVCVARPELLEVRPHWGGGKLNATSVRLEPLSEAESVLLVENLAASVELDDRSRKLIVEAAGGNPLFVEEMLALLLEDGRAGGALEVPPTIQALLAARLDRLSDDERATIEAAAVEGKVFHEASVAELLSAPPSAVRESLESLVRKELVRPDRPVFSGERGVRLPPPADSGRGVRVDFRRRHALPSTSGMQRWLERTAGRPHPGARGDPRLPPRAGVHLPDPSLARPTSDARARSSCGGATRGGRSARFPAQRWSRWCESHLAQRRAPAPR